MAVRFRKGDDVVYTDPDTSRWCRARLTTDQEGWGMVPGVVVRRGTLPGCRRGELWELPTSWLTLLLESGAHVAAMTFLGAAMSWVACIWMLVGGGLVPGLITLGVAVAFTAVFVTKTAGVIATYQYAKTWLRATDGPDTTDADQPGSDELGPAPAAADTSDVEVAA